MRVWAVALLMTSLVVAGCVDSSDGADGGDEGAAQVDHGPGFVYDAVDAAGLPVPVLLCLDGLVITAYTEEVDGAQAWSDFQVLPDEQRCNLEMTPDHGREGNEVTIAVNPKDPRNIVGGAKDYYPADAGECVWDGVYVSHDGGRTPFEDRSFDGSPWRQMNEPDPSKVNYATQLWCTTDPVAYFNTEGELYYLLMAYQADPVTGSKACEAECPNGALNDWAFNRAVQIIAISSDGGDTFHTFTPVLEGSFPVNFHDKGWIAASHNGIVHVMWLAFFVPGNQYCRSTDDGGTYLCTEVAGIQAVESGQGSFIEVGTGPDVYLSWYNGGIRIRHSGDYGETWPLPSTEDQERGIDLVTPTNPQSMPGLSGRDRRTGFPAMATDRNPESPFADAIYFVWNDACGDARWAPRAECEVTGNNSIYFTSSFDKGQTWNDPIRIDNERGPDGGLSAEGWSIFPAVSVSPGGVIDVSWMETRDTRRIDCPADPGLGEADCDGTYHAFDQYYTYSLDGGITWSEPINIRDAGDRGWDPALCHHQNGNIFIGDYNDIDSSWQAAHPVWPDSRDGHCDVYTATVQRPMFAQGWGDEERRQAEDVIRGQPL